VEETRSAPEGLGAAASTLIEELEDSRDAERTARASDYPGATELVGDLAELQPAEAHVAHDRDHVLFRLEGLELHAVRREAISPGAAAPESPTRPLELRGRHRAQPQEHSLVRAESALDLGRTRLVTTGGRGVHDASADVPREVLDDQPGIARSIERAGLGHAEHLGARGREGSEREEDRGALLDASLLSCVDVPPENPRSLSLGPLPDGPSLGRLRGHRGS
jgi:hypothetical protein